MTSDTNRRESRRYVSVRIVDTTGKTLTEPGWIQFSTSPNDTVSVRDNTAKDLDPAIGVIKAALTKSGNYKACFSRSAHYYRDYGAGLQKWPNCRSLSTNAMNVDLGKVYGQRAPIVTLITKNQFGSLVGGASFDFLIPDSGWNLIFADGNMSYDESAGANGIITYTLGWPHVFQICEFSPPAKSILTSPACQTIDAKWGQSFTFTFYHETQIF